MSNYKYIAQELEKEITKTEEELRATKDKIKNLEFKYPKSHITCSKNGNRYKLYMSNERGRQYIPKSRRALAEGLVQKRYYSDLIVELESKVKACQSFILEYESLKREADDMFLNPAYSELLQGINCLDAIKGGDKNDFELKIQNLRDEKYNVEFEPNSDYLNYKYADSLTVQGTQGKQLRSKSEAIIDLLLFKSGLDYKYEYPIRVEGRVFYPDFTIFSRKMNKLIYWEHFGMMDDQYYRQKAFEKMVVYSNNNILLGSNLIATFETMENPLNISEVENIISRYF